MLFVALLVIVCGTAAGFLLIGLIHFSKMGFKRYEKARHTARQLVQKEQLGKAKLKVSNALKNIGWDYDGLLAARKAKRLIGIEGTRSFWHRMAYAMKVLPENTVEWAVPGLLLLGEIYEKQGMIGTAYQLYDDVLGYMEAQKDLMPRISKTRAESEIHSRLYSIDLAEGNFLTSLKHYVTHIMYGIQLTKLENNEIEFRAKYPYKGDDNISEIVAKMDRKESMEKIIETINRNINMEMGRMHVDRAQREVNSLVTGRKTIDDKTREATRVMLTSVIEKAKEQDDAEKEDKDDDDDVILL